MKKALFLFGLLIIFFASLLWVSASPANFYHMTFGEFITLFLIGILLMLPEVIFQAHQFFTSGSSEDVPF